MVNHSKQACEIAGREKEEELPSRKKEELSFRRKGNLSSVVFLLALPILSPIRRLSVLEKEKNIFDDRRVPRSALLSLCFQLSVRMWGMCLFL